MTMSHLLNKRNRKRQLSKYINNTNDAFIHTTVVLTIFIIAVGDIETFLKYFGSLVHGASLRTLFNSSSFTV